MSFSLQSPFKPTGDQPQAIAALVDGVNNKNKYQTLMGVTGSGKTFTMANIIAQTQRPTLVLAHNKTLAAQLASEFRRFFPHNAVHYFVSYYDYYQPEAYIARTDTYIEKETDINDEIDRLRHASTFSLLTRKDVIIVASVSCIYGIGTRTSYLESFIGLKKGNAIKRQTLLRSLVNLRYQRNDLAPSRSAFHVKGDTLDIYPSYGNHLVRITFFGDMIENIEELDPLTYRPLPKEESVMNGDEVIIPPARLYMTQPTPAIISTIRDDLRDRLAYFKKKNKLVEAQRLEQRVNFDLEMIEATGYANGIENYSRYFDKRAPGEPPETLMDFFPDEYLLFVDESHMTLPQVRGMYNGDRARKEALIDFGFRLPAALDNRPLRYEEFLDRIKQAIFVSATPRPYELGLSQKYGRVAEQLVRPTGLLDPTIEILPTKNQIDHLIAELQSRIKKKQRALVTTMTKKMAEELAEYLQEMKIKVHYLHSDVDTMERLEILRDLRAGTVDVVVGVNLLREGLDLPEVSLVAIFDADKESFLRDDISLVQIMGRAARHGNGHVIMYANSITGSMKRAIAETKRRRRYQEDYNKKHNITPATINKEIAESRLGGKRKDERNANDWLRSIPKDEITRATKELMERMEIAAKNLEFEEAAKLRDEILVLKKRK